MIVIREIHEMHQLGLEWSRQGVRSALVPTMGALHEGHRRLIRLARGLGDRVVVSIYVNPAQFGPNEDFGKYPRMFESDCATAEKEGADVVFAPASDAIYPAGYQTYVKVEELSQPLCGQFRPVHFRGVATVVLKLFNIVQPRVAVFGWKDAQQFILLKRMVQDLNLPIEMVGAETVRESDGLAMSSRNQYLSAEERSAARNLYRALCALRDAAENGERDAEKVLALARLEIEKSPLLKIQYLEMVSLDRLEKLNQIQPGNTLVAVAAYLGATRLIDNIRL